MLGLVKQLGSSPTTPKETGLQLVKILVDILKLGGGMQHGRNLQCLFPMEPLACLNIASCRTLNERISKTAAGLFKRVDRSFSFMDKKYKRAHISSNKTAVAERQHNIRTQLQFPEMRIAGFLYLSRTCRRMDSILSLESLRTA